MGRDVLITVILRVNHNKAERKQRTRNQACPPRCAQSDHCITPRHVFQVSGIWGHEGIQSTLRTEALFGCSVSPICSLCSGYLESHLLLHLLSHLSSGPALSSSMPLPCTGEQMLVQSRLHFRELQDGPRRCLVHEFSACQVLRDS